MGSLIVLIVFGSTESRSALEEVADVLVLWLTATRSKDKWRFLASLAESDWNSLKPCSVQRSELCSPILKCSHHVGDIHLRGRSTNMYCCIHWFYSDPLLPVTT